MNKYIKFLMIGLGTVLISGCVTLYDKGTFYSEEQDVEYTYYYHPGSVERETEIGTKRNDSNGVVNENVIYMEEYN